MSCVHPSLSNGRASGGGRSPYFDVVDPGGHEVALRDALYAAEYVLVVLRDHVSPPDLRCAQ
jgi:hypothetical protein